jgi:hypothetical protein
MGILKRSPDYGFVCIVKYGREVIALARAGEILGGGHGRGGV